VLREVEPGGGVMRSLRYLALLAVLAVVPMAKSQAQVAFGWGWGPYGWAGVEPACAWGYYGYYPYACAPYGYWGPNWFVGGVFIGAGPWFRGFGFRGFGYRGFGFRGPFAGRGGFGFGHEAWRGGHGAGWGGSGFAGRGFAGAGRGWGGGGFRGSSGFHGGGGYHGGYGAGSMAAEASTAEAVEDFMAAAVAVTVVAGTARLLRPIRFRRKIQAISD